MGRVVALTDGQGQSVWVNLDVIVWMRRTAGDDATQIYFGNIADQLFVKERPSEIQELAGTGTSAP